MVPSQLVARPLMVTFPSLLELLPAGRQFQYTVVWSGNLIMCFLSVKKHSSLTDPLALPNLEVQLWIVTITSLKMSGFGASLYIFHDQKINLSKFSSSK